MNQNEAVLLAMEQLNGFATLGQLYKTAPRIPGSEWRTKTPFASIRRIVQLHPGIYKIKPGLYGLKSHRQQNEQRGIIAESEKNKNSEEMQQFNHTYYQGLLLTIGKLMQFDTWAPNQDRNKIFLNQTIGSCRSYSSIPPFSYPKLVQRSETIDVIWFNEREMPHSYFEVENTTDIQNSLLKYLDLQDFAARMLIVSPRERKPEFEKKAHYTAFKDIRKRLEFLDYDSLVKEYEYRVEASQREVRF